ncbi:hypothetical protein [Streptomyces sp. NPDC056650]|uniref:hypothetical protein n=1 Tax=Streptomyces sp. NPDC056650 TaxID=3154856 RepID=UPI00341F2AF6
MSGIRFEFDPRSLPGIMQTEQVRGALKVEAEKIVPRAKALARAEVSDAFAESISVAQAPGGARTMCRARSPTSPNWNTASDC